MSAIILLLTLLITGRAAAEATPPPAGSKSEVLVDSATFWPALNADIEAARDRVWVQSMSFEADSAGLALARALLRSTATDRRVLVDSYTKLCISDRFEFSPRFWFSPRLQAEARATRRMMHTLRDGGVRVQFTNPLGPNPLRIFDRNHKKMILVDSTVCYLGGINFTDHNFSWHDMMLRLERPDLARFLAQDFEATWAGRDLDRTEDCGGLQLVSMDGHNNRERFAPLLDRIRSARESIWVESPYLSFPFYDALREARRRGVAVTVITPLQNNKGIMDSYTIWESGRSGIELRHTQRMTHLKAILIDGSTLITGSANFDALSYTSQQEIVLFATDSLLVRQVMDSVMRPDIEASRVYRGGPRPIRGRLAYWQINFVNSLAELCPSGRR